jgi:hypothetical protein
MYQYRHLHLVQVLLLFTIVSVVPAAAQTPSDTAVFYVSPDEYEVWVPTTCPTYLRGGFAGYLYGFRHQGYWWHADWVRTGFVGPGWMLPITYPLPVNNT